MEQMSLFFGRPITINPQKYRRAHGEIRRNPINHQFGMVEPYIVVPQFDSVQLVNITS